MTQPIFPKDAPDATTAHEQRALIALSLVSGVGAGRMRGLLARFGSAEAVMSASATALQRVPMVGRATARAIVQFDDYAEVDRQLERAAQVEATLLAPWDAQFPQPLRQIYDPPGMLWVRGTLREADRRALAIVGTRRCTEYGRRQARRFAEALAREGFTIVSGLAYGVDAAAHRGALAVRGRTLAVLGSGVNRIYPGKHNSLAQEITEQGALLSEYPLDAPPDASNFPERNRIISGLTLGTLVVESHASGGALITARMAVEQDREVFAVPNILDRSAGVGANRLIQRGHAKLVIDVEDVLDELNMSARPPSGASNDAPDDPPSPDLGADEERLLAAISTEPMHIDAICRAVDLDPSTALVHLLSLEFKGCIRQMAGKQFYRV